MGNSDNKHSENLKYVVHVLKLQINYTKLEQVLKSLKKDERKRFLKKIDGLKLRWIGQQTWKNERE